MADFQLCGRFPEDLGRGAHAFGADEFRVLLTNAEPKPTDGRRGDVAELPEGNGYPEGGQPLAAATFGPDAEGARFTAGVTIFRAKGGKLGPFRFAWLYNASAEGQPLVGYWDYEEEVTLKAGETFAVDVDPAAGVLLVARGPTN